MTRNRVNTLLRSRVSNVAEELRRQFLTQGRARSPHDRAKRKKANGGCPGIKSRRRTWYTAKSIGEPCAGNEPVMSEWGNPARRTLVTAG